MQFLSMLLSWPNSRGVRIGVFTFFVLLLIYFFLPSSDYIPTFSPNHESSPPPLTPALGNGASAPPETGASLDPSLVEDVVQYFVDFPLQPPYKHVFGELGDRTRIVRDWLLRSDDFSSLMDPSTRAVLKNSVEKAVMALYPFLRSPPRKPSSQTPLSDLRSTFAAGSAGIVIPAGDGIIRYAAQLVVSLRSVLGSTLPIEIAYAGDKDLSAANRQRLSEHVAALAGSGAGGAKLDFVDITTIFDSSTLRFGEANGGWATKAFAALGSRFEKVILVDADAVFLQAPEVLLPLVAGRESASSPYQQPTGAFLFHDRLLWQHAFKERHDWWKSQVRRPSGTLNQSLVWTEDYAEEGDSGVVVMDKSRADVLMGLLHVCWQNTYEVREEITYKITYGDKESWWFGFELAGTPYEMERHYGGIVGWEQEPPRGKDDKPGTAGKEASVCSFVIAHVDEQDRLLWYNGGLLKNKLRDDTLYEVPQKWMLDGEWKKGASKADMSCMVGGKLRSLTTEETDVLSRSIELAKELDVDFRT